jgi:hypothetical protein
MKLCELTYKLVMLCALITGQRCQSLHLMSLDSLVKHSSAYQFVINKLVKQSAPGKKQPVLVIPKFPEDQRLCIFSVLKEYLARAKALRSQKSQLFISFIRPHKKVSKDTMGRWIKHIMKCAGIAISSIMKAASWASDCTFHEDC